jgi:protoporphyrinogen oxidase
MEIGLVGAGISGLSLAFLIKKYLPNTSIYIIDKNISGKIKTKILELDNTKYFIELGPDSLVYNEKFNKINTEFNLNKLNIIFFSNNPNYVFFNNKIYKIPTNIPDFLLSNLISLESKFQFVLSLFKEIKYNQDDTLLTFCQKNFNNEFNEKILYPLFSNVFSTDIDKLSIIPLIPYLKNIKTNILKNKSTKFFNFKNGLYSLTEYLYNFLKNNKVKFINENLINFELKDNGYLLKTENNYLEVSKLFFTIPAFDLNQIINNSLSDLSNLNKNPVLFDLLKNLTYLLKSISYHSSYIYILVLNKFLNKKINGILFKEHSIFKAISFFSKKWNNSINDNINKDDKTYSKKNKIEFLRIFFKNKFDKDLNYLIKELNKINLLENIKLNDILYSEYVEWEDSILTNNINLFKNLKEIKIIVNKLREYNIYILANFIGGSSIIDRLYNSIEFINEFIKDYKEEKLKVK